MTTTVYDAIVVGLGAVGAAAAWQLARRGARVLGIDRHAPPHAHGSSHGDTRITRLAIGGHAAGLGPFTADCDRVDAIAEPDGELPGHAPKGDEAPLAEPRSHAVSEADATRPAAMPVEHREIAGSRHGPEARRRRSGTRRTSPARGMARKLARRR